ncbi:hypothetical protein GCM10011376_33370 [Nocardioides flavus (ex Wang et al. 2016)]|uniref:Uncharacterized protein n=1 Tax=Nocardioides flavus (ex Wang et al. 2016) TaxID=2058780 RepID=A0ABQ3HQ14_9ACTN|nr:hypothetical protein [Nocardioides flavus (ex Wang et al. 2016)]GHE18727.1 hypothetical protein GCM10011376_33370 [Nocardioides flavus (ex Wang et al. 2016)]
MRLVSAVLGFVLRKTGALLAVVVSLFLAYLLVQAAIPAVKEAVTDRERLQQMAAERAALEEDLQQLRDEVEEARREEVAARLDSIGAEVDALGDQVSDQRDEVADKVAESEECGRLRELVEDLPLVPNTCDLKQRAAESAQATLETLESGLARAEADASVLGDPDLTPQQKLEQVGADGAFARSETELDAAESELAQKQAEERSLEQTQGSGVGWVVDQWARSWRWLAAVALAVLLLPPVLRTFSYFVLMPLVHRAHRPINLAGGSEGEAGVLRTSEAERTLTVELGPGEVLSARSEHVRPVQGRARSHLLYDWSSPFISYAAGLFALSRVTGGERVTAATLSTPDDPDSYLMRIDFVDHPGLVMRPRHVVGVIGTPELGTRWRWGIQSFATWQVRYILFSGTGSLIVQGHGDVVATSPRGGTTRMEQHLVMGFDSQLLVGVNRTEVFWPYLWGRAPLVDDEFSGQHPFFWQKASAAGPGNPVARAFDTFFSALGKLLGF